MMTRQVPQAVALFALFLSGCHSSGGGGGGGEPGTTIWERQDLFGSLQTVRWVAYAPSGRWDPDNGLYPSEDTVRQDLRLLAGHGFEGVITYGATEVLGRVPQMAREEGFRAVIMGIWNPTDPIELEQALLAQGAVDGYCVGNEGLTYPYANGLDYTLEELTGAIASIKSSTGLPVTTSEPASSYTEGCERATAADLQGLGDWLFPAAHPYWDGVIDPAGAASWTESVFNGLWSVTGKPVFCKEVGLPTAGAGGLSEDAQLDYYRDLWRLDVAFAWFEAFDQRWKDRDPVETHWGIFTADRDPKPAAIALVEDPIIEFTSVPRLDSFEDLHGRVRNVDPDAYRIVVYIRVGSTWWVKPYAAWPLTRIDADGTWSCDVTTGGIDQAATAYEVFLVRPDYDADLHERPAEADAVARHGVLRK